MLAGTVDIALDRDDSLPDRLQRSTAGKGGIMVLFNYAFILLMFIQTYCRVLFSWQGNRRILLSFTLLLNHFCMIILTNFMLYLEWSRGRTRPSRVTANYWRRDRSRRSFSAPSKVPRVQGHSPTVLFCLSVDKTGEQLRNPSLVESDDSDSVSDDSISLSPYSR